MFGWFLDSAEKKARKQDLEDLRSIMEDIRASARNAAQKAGEASQRVLIEDSELDAEIAKTYAQSVEALRHSHRSMALVEAKIEKKLRDLGTFSKWKTGQVASTHQIA